MAGIRLNAGCYRQALDCFAMVPHSRCNYTTEEVCKEVGWANLQLLVERLSRLCDAFITAVFKNDVAEIEVRSWRSWVDCKRGPEFLFCFGGEPRLFVSAPEEK